QIDGKRLHELARQGIEVERAPRPVTVHRLEVGEFAAPGVLPIEVECSSGTYIRTLAADLGGALGGGAHLRNLRRTRVGPFTLADARQLAAIDDSVVVPMADALAHLDRVVVDEEVATAVRHGKVLALEVLGVTGPGPWAVLDDHGALLAVYEPHAGATVKPAVVVAS
ncbi:MAG: tRNA pseudouridine(55) synthase TruB, partial [Acidimicrobiales bacterium]